MSSDGVTVVNKRELAKLLVVSVVTVNAFMDRLDNFPVVQPGTNGKVWQFDAATVKVFMAAREAEKQQAE